MSGSSVPNIKQADRILGMTSPLGGDVLVLRYLTVTEAIGYPYYIEAEALSPRDDIKPQELIGKPITCRVSLSNQDPRYFHGIVNAVSMTGSYFRNLTSYRLTAVPRLWQLSRTVDCRIFQDQTTQAILSTLLDEGSVAPKRFGTLPGTQRPYTVQFNESDLDFFNRLVDEVGGGYFFQHSDGDHTLVVTGANADFPLLKVGPLVAGNESDRRNIVTGWNNTSQVKPGKHVAHDFDGLNPSSLKQAEASTLLQTAGGDASTWEVFRWPAGQTVRPDHEAGKLHMEQLEAGADEVRAQSDAAALYAGARIPIKPSTDGAPANWLITAMRHEARDETQLSDGGSADYSNSFVLIAADRPWRNKNPRPRPFMPGLQSAIVTGPSGSEIHCDEHGRIKVHFLWDRKGKKDDNSSCYVRVAQPYAGKWGGSWFLPRIGDEVLVAFLDGDPDRPVVVGSLYNAESPPPFPLPANKTQSGFRTRSSEKGGSDNANILRFEDKKGSEEILLHAEKDLTVEVENDEKRTVGHDRTTSIQNNDTLSVEEGDLSTEIKKGNESLKIDMGNRSAEISMGNDSLSIKMGNLSIKCDLGSISIEAMQSIELKVGQSSVKVDQMGVTVKGMMVSSEGQIQNEVKGLMTSVKGDAMVQVSAGIIMIG